MISIVNLKLKTLFLATTFILSSCATSLELNNALAITPYTILQSGRIVVEVRVNDQGPYRFALDTGSSISVIFDELRDELELDTIPGESITMHGLVASEEFSLLDVARLQLGHETWLNPRIASLPGDTAAAVDIDGILGIDFLRQYAIGFSTGDRAVRLYSPDLFRDDAYRGWASVSFDYLNLGEGNAALYFFKVEIGGQKVKALFDLGAGLNLINWPGARALRLTAIGKEGREILAGIVEDTPVVAQFSARDVATAGIHWRNELFVVADLEIFETLQQVDDPFVILGSGLFRQRDFVIDFARSRLLVKVSMREVDGEEIPL